MSLPPKITLPKNKETYLATLYGKALDAASLNSILNDTFAAAALARIEYDFAALKLPRGGDISLPLRARHFDDWTRAFLAEHPSATVLHLGCGLDTRVFRIDPGPSVRWFDIDLPDVIALRRQLYRPRPNYELVSASVTDPAWLDVVRSSNQPVCVVAEGLMMYIHEADGLALFRRITERFPSGQIAFDAYSRAMTQLVSRLATVRGAQVELVWGLGDPHELEQQVPGLHLAESVAFLAMPELAERTATNAFTFAINKMLLRWPFYHKLVRHVRYTFP